MPEEKLVGSYRVCVNCGTKVFVETDNDGASNSCEYCGKGSLVKVEVRVLKERAHADGMRAGLPIAFMWGVVFILIGYNLTMVLIGMAAGFALGYFPEKSGRNRMR